MSSASPVLSSFPSSSSSSSSSSLSSDSGSSPRFYCNYPHCNKSFSRSSHLSRHMRIHLGTKPFSCGFQGCQKKFSRRDCWREHMRGVHGIVSIEASKIPVPAPYPHQSRILPTPSSLPLPPPPLSPPVPPSSSSSSSATLSLSRSPTYFSTPSKFFYPEAFHSSLPSTTTHPYPSYHHQFDHSHPLYQEPTQYATPPNSYPLNPTSRSTHSSVPISRPSSVCSASYSSFLHPSISSHGSSSSLFTSPPSSPSSLPPLSSSSSSTSSSLPLECFSPSIPFRILPRPHSHPPSSGFSSSTHWSSCPYLPVSL